MVERTGRKLVDLLHKSNAWSDQDCGREDCLVCSSCVENERRGLCMRRNVVYETFCLSCYYKEKAEKESLELKKSSKSEKKKEENRNKNVRGTDELEVKTNVKKRKRDERENVKKKIENLKRDFKVKYVGETGRSSYERAKEHMSDFRNLVDTSHLLKHYILKHQDEMKIDEMKFGMRVKKSYTTAIERQVAEAVSISFEKKKGTTLLNSKAEYNRCNLPRISTKSKKDIEKEKESEDAEEKVFQDKIKELKREKRTRRLEKIKEKEESQPLLKKLKRICVEITNENVINWHERRKKQEELKRIKEKEEDKEIKRIERVRKGEIKKKELVTKLRSQRMLKPEKKDEKWIENRKSAWRRYRESRIQDSIIEDAENPRKKSELNGPGSPIFDDNLQDFSRKSPIFRDKFSDFSREEAQFSKKKDFLEEIGHKRGFKFTFRKSVLNVDTPAELLIVDQRGKNSDVSLNLGTISEKNAQISKDPPAYSDFESDLNLDKLFEENSHSPPAC